MSQGDLSAASLRSSRGRWTTAVLFAVALVARLLFWQATPDRSWPHSVLYKGDAVVWSDYAGALSRGERFELGLPLRPPANAYLLSWLGVEGAEDAAAAKPIWCLLGAAVVALFYRAALAAFGPAVALLTALWCALSTGLLVLSTSLNNETPYLVLVGAILLLAPRFAAEPSAARALAWGGLHGLACLVRVEHLLFALAAAGWVLWLRRRRETSRRRRRRLALLAAPLAIGFCLVLLPWHLAAWSKIREFNHEPPTLDPVAEAAQLGVERATRALRWTDEARAARLELPAFARRPAANFVAATVLIRGGHEVGREDFSILEEAFGTRPRALPARPFVALYGPLNFYLANRAGAPAGFDPDGLERAPPLSGGIDRYPRALVAGLPPPQLNFSYPPHVEAVTDGYRLGRDWIRHHPGEFLDLAAARLDLLWRGAALGWTGHGLPWGLAGVRRAVDLTVPDGVSHGVWRVILLALCLAGVWRARRAEALPLWLLFAGAKLVAAVSFFGYARHGATLIPVVAALAAVAIADLVRRAGPTPSGAALGLRIALFVALVGLAVEGHRWLRPPTIVLDDRPVVGRDPFPRDDHLEHRLTLRSTGN